MVLLIIDFLYDQMLTIIVTGTRSDIVLHFTIRGQCQRHCASCSNACTRLGSNNRANGTDAARSRPKFRFPDYKGTTRSVLGSRQRRLNVLTTLKTRAASHHKAYNIFTILTLQHSPLREEKLERYNNKNNKVD